MQKRALGRNSVASYSKKDEKATSKNGVVGRSDMKGGIENANKNMF